MFNYLVTVVEESSVYSEDWTWFQKACSKLLSLLFAGRYAEYCELRKLRRQTNYLKEDNARYSKKLVNSLHLYAAHIGEPAYSMLWHTLDIPEECEVLKERMLAPGYLDISDAEFKQHIEILRSTEAKEGM